MNTVLVGLDVGIVSVTKLRHEFVTDRLRVRQQCSRCTFILPELIPLLSEPTNLPWHGPGATRAVISKV